jgi:hypothetical protein
VIAKTAGLGFIAAVVVIPGLVLVFAAQGQDLLQAVADGLDPGDEPGRLNRTLGWLLFSAWFLGLESWFWARTIIGWRFGARSGWEKNPFLVWAPRLLGLLPFILLAAGFWQVGAWDGRIWALLAVGVALLLFVVLRVRIVRRLHALSTRAAPAGRAARLSLVLSRTMMLRGSVGLALAGLVVLSIWPVAPTQAVGPAAVALIGLALIVPVVAVLGHWGHRAHIAVGFVLVALALLFSAWVDNHHVRLLDGAVGARPTVPTAFEAWSQGLPADGRTAVPIIFVASQGGASRAGYWTADAMALLEEETGGQFSRHLFAVSSISGGSLGAAAFVAALHDDPGLVSAHGLRKRVEGFVRQDYLSPAVGGFLFPDLVQRVLPVAFLPDRARALEAGWEAGWIATCRPGSVGCTSAGRMGDSFLSLWPAQGGGWLPMLLVGGATQETGWPILTSSLDFQTPPWAGDPLVTRFIDADDFHAVAKRDVRLSTAILNGARFPYISPAGTLPPPGQHIVDGGYFEAAGVETIHQLAGRMFDPRSKLLTVRPGLTLQPVYLLLQNGDPPGLDEHVTIDAVAQDAWGPLRGLFHARSAHGLRLMLDLRAAPPAAGATPAKVITLQVCQRLAMDWALSAKMTAALRSDLDRPPPAEIRTPEDACLCANINGLRELEQMLGAPPRAACLAQRPPAPPPAR